MAGGIDNISSPGDVEISSLFCCTSAVCNCVHFNSSFTSFRESLSVMILCGERKKKVLFQIIS